jgi:hypothetical protein
VGWLVSVKIVCVSSQQRDRKRDGKRERGRETHQDIQTWLDARASRPNRDTQQKSGVMTGLRGAGPVVKDSHPSCYLLPSKERYILPFFTLLCPHRSYQDLQKGT